MGMARISYLAPDEVEDTEARKWLEDAISKGRPGPENQSIRAHQVGVMRSFMYTRDLLFNKKTQPGVVEHDLKELARAYVALSLDCDY